MNHHRPLLLLALLLLTSVCTEAQQALSRMELGFNAGAMNYLGDLNNQSALGKVNPAIGCHFRSKYGSRWALVVGAAYGHVEGGNPDAIARRNLSFRSYVAEATVRMEFNFLPYGIGEAQFRWTPFIFGGLGFFAFNPQAYYTDPLSGESQWYDLQPLGTEGQGTPLNPDASPYTLMQVNMPFGLGLKIKASKSITIAAEYGFRKTWTDYLDDCSTIYVDNEQLSSARGNVAAGLADRSAEVEPGYVNAHGIKRGDDSLNDWYAYFNLSVSVGFNVLFGWMHKKNCNP